MQDPVDDGVFMFCKTATDRNQRGSTVVVVVMDDKIFASFHPHPPKTLDPRTPASTAAAITLDVLKRGQSPVPDRLSTRLQEIATGEIGPHYVGEKETPRPAPVALRPAVHKRPAAGVRAGL